MHEVLQAEERTPAGVETTATTTVRPAVPTVRNLAVDAYRGLVMLLMMGEVFSLPKFRRTTTTVSSGKFLPSTRPTPSGLVVHCTT